MNNLLPRRNGGPGRVLILRRDRCCSTGCARVRSAYGSADTRAAHLPVLIPSFHSWMTKLDTHRPALEVQGSTSEPAVRRVFARERSGPSAVAVRRAGTDRLVATLSATCLATKRLTPGTFGVTSLFGCGPSNAVLRTCACATPSLQTVLPMGRLSFERGLNQFLSVGAPVARACWPLVSQCPRRVKRFPSLLRRLPLVSHWRSRAAAAVSLDGALRAWAVSHARRGLESPQVIVGV